LKKGNDIDQSIVFNELDKYGEVDKYNYQWFRSYDYDSRHNDFDQVDAVILTNAKKEFRKFF
jgi:hypothetical protein